MNLFEAGVVPGIPTGAVIGGVICKSHGVLAVVGGSLVGAISGAVAGLIYAYVVMFFMVIIGVFWRAVRKRPVTSPVDNDIAKMSQTAIPGIIVGVLTGTIFYIALGWLPALIIIFVVASVTAFVAVAQCQLQGHAPGLVWFSSWSSDGIARMRYFILLLFSVGSGLMARIIPSEYGWLYELVVPWACILIIIVGWRRVSLVRKFMLLVLALLVGWFADWSWYTIIRHPDDSVALRAGLILLIIRAGIGIAVLIPAHFAWKNRYANII
jgi:hypothetical protein